MEKREITRTIATGPWVSDPGYLRRRVVLRESWAEFIVHTEVVDREPSPVYEEATSFHHGHYIPKGDRGQPGTAESILVAYERAWNAFDSACRKMLGWPIGSARDVAHAAQSVIAQLAELLDQPLSEAASDDYMLESNLDTFTSLTGIALYLLDDEDETETDDGPPAISER